MQGLAKGWAWTDTSALCPMEMRGPVSASRAVTHMEQQGQGGRRRGTLISGSSPEVVRAGSQEDGLGHTCGQRPGWDSEVSGSPFQQDGAPLEAASDHMVREGLAQEVALV